MHISITKSIERITIQKAIYGFGPVTHDLKSTIDQIINEIKNNCLLRKKYLRRIKKFFTYFDEHNNDRIYNKILNNIKLEKPLRETFSIILNIFEILINIKLLITIKNIIIEFFNSIFSIHI